MFASSSIPPLGNRLQRARGARRPYRQGGLSERAAQTILRPRLQHPPAIFSDIRVREALGLLLDFEWLNHNFFYDRYKRSASYFEDSELSARGRAASDRERALLKPFPDAVRADVMDGTWQPAVSDGSGRDRAMLKHALALLETAGYALDGSVLAQS